MKRLFKSLLPKKLNDREALNFEFLNIKPRFFPRSLGFKRLKYIFVVLLVLGYYPNLNLPVTSHSNSVAAAEQIVKISAENLPEPFQLPHPGYISTHFSYYHPGTDIATGLGMPIHPVASGEVTYVEYGFWGLGHDVVISHKGGFASTYGHMGRIFVKVGDKVTPSSFIGEVGLTGNTSGPHTHLEISKDGIRIDPMTILPALPNFPSESDFKPVGGIETKIENKTELRKTLKPDFS